MLEGKKIHFITHITYVFEVLFLWVGQIWSVFSKLELPYHNSIRNIIAIIKPWKKKEENWKFKVHGTYHITPNLYCSCAEYLKIATIEIRKLTSTLNLVFLEGVSLRHFCPCFCGTTCYSFMSSVAILHTIWVLFFFMHVVAKSSLVEPSTWHWVSTIACTWSYKDQGHLIT